MIKGYFIETKFHYFKDNSFNYNKFSKDIRSNSILERYTKTIKKELGEKCACNCVVFTDFINNELSRINEILTKNENVNILYNIKMTKFGKNKYVNNIIDNSDNNKNNIIYNEEDNKISKEIISAKLLVQKENNCRYNAVTTLIY